MEKNDLFESQFDIRSRMEEELEERAYTGLASSMDRSGAGFRDGFGDPFDDAVTACLKYHGAKPGRVPSGITSEDMRMEYICRHSGIMHRKVKLKDNWYERFLGPMLARLKSGEAVALLPGSVGGCYYHEPHTGRRCAVNSKNSSLFEKEAVFFYPALPTKALSSGDFLYFILRTLKAGDILFVILMAAGGVLVGLMPALINKLAFDTVLNTGQSRYIAPLAALFVGATVSLLFINACRNLLTGKISIKTGVYAEAAVYARLLTLPAEFFRRYDSGNLATRIFIIKEFARLLTAVFAGAGLSLVLSLTYIFQIGAYTPALRLPAFGIFFVQTVLILAASFITLKYERIGMEKGARLSGTVTSIITGIQKIKLAGAENRSFYKWSKRYADYAAPTYNRPAVMEALPSCITVIGVIGGIMIINRASFYEVSYDNYMAFNAAYGQISAAVISAAVTAQQAVKLGAMLDLVKPILKETPEAASEKQVVESLRGAVELTKVSFRYNEKSPRVLDDISFKVNPGEYVAITGPSGCGKSTLIRLLLGFEKPEKGNIFYDSHNIQTVDLHSLRRHIGTVLQNGKLFVGDIFYNIILSAPDSSMEDAWRAARIAGIDEDIKRMPMGMKTLISEGGSGLSGGQRQRLMIARAVCNDPQILILDEATSALDNITQKHVSDSLDSLNCTRIVVAHRLSTIKNCDRVLCMKDGRIIEEGSYDELMTRKGFFAELVETQRLEGSEG